MKTIKDKNILFIAPTFFGYAFEIKNKLEHFGAKVDLYDEKPSNNFIIKVFIRLYRKSFSSILNKYFEEIIKNNISKNYDYILFIKGETLDVKIVTRIKNKFPNAETILYLWDSFQYYKDIIQCIPLFTRVLTFDYYDSQSIPLVQFRPLFYIDDCLACNNNNLCSQQTDFYLLFIGTIHSDRWVFLKKIYEQAKNQNFNLITYLYIQSPAIYFFRIFFTKQLTNLSFKRVNFTQIARTEMINLMKNAQAILDIQSPNQTGLTMRTIEAFGADKKLITTNSEIVKYDFFNCNNILVIDRKKPIIPKDFFTKEYISVEDDIKYKYSVEGWILDVFNL